MRVLLTGATGFIGSALPRRLLADGRHEIAALLRPTSDCWRIEDLMGRFYRIAGTLDEPEAAEAEIAAFAFETVSPLGLGQRRQCVPQ